MKVHLVVDRLAGSERRDATDPIRSESDVDDVQEVLGLNRFAV